MNLTNFEIPKQRAGSQRNRSQAKTQDDKGDDSLRKRLTSHQFPGRELPLQKSIGGAIWRPYICARITARFIPHNSTQAYKLKRHRTQKQNWACVRRRTKLARVPPTTPKASCWSFMCETVEARSDNAVVRFYRNL